MRILMISDVYFPRVNGVSTSIYTFRQHLVAKGHKVTLIVPEYREKMEDDDDIIRIASRYVPFDPEDRMFKQGDILQRIPELEKENYDLLHIQTPFVAHYAGIKLAKALGIPSIITYHTFFEEYLYNYVPFVPKSWLKLLARRFSAGQCNEVNAVIVPSTPIEERLREYGVETPITRLPTGIDLNKFKGGDGMRFREANDIPLHRPVMVYVGRVAHEKNIDFLLHVLNKVREKIPNVLLIIAGEGPAEVHLRKLVRKLDLAANVLFVGYLDRNTELLDCYMAGDVFVFASRTETQGLVLLEAMALGVPVVSTAVLGTADVLRQGEGVLIADDSIEHFAYTTIRVLMSDDLKDSLQATALEYVKDWSAERFFQELELFYIRVYKQSFDAETQIVEAIANRD